MAGTHDGALVPDEGAMVDEHGRPPGVPSRSGTGSPQPPADPARYAEANARPDPAAAAGTPPARDNGASGRGSRGSRGSQGGQGGAGGPGGGGGGAGSAGGP
ncbi:hypothetical protein [Streptomyces sp. NPDC007369]|uniref:hypothetical protein n=1 Tax=Streptomyces sp. NPDC007369 TaxID=3154589 RepID=UPI0033CABF78